MADKELNEKLDEKFPDFCCEMRARTKDVHDESDKLVRLKLVVVLTDTRLWAQSLAQFYFVFRTMESCLERLRNHPVIGAIYVPEEMYRAAAFERDLQFYLGLDWKESVGPSEQTDEYCNRLRQIEVENPKLLLAYIHSMYLALLAGGQIIKRIVRRTLGVSDKEGLSVFDFDCADRTKMKSAFMESINGLPLTQEDKEDIIKEKLQVFRRNNTIVESVNPTFTNYQRLIKLIALVVVVIAVFAYGLLSFYQLI